jgi:hypothetical protein
MTVPIGENDAARYNAQNRTFIDDGIVNICDKNNK